MAGELDALAEKYDTPVKSTAQGGPLDELAAKHGGEDASVTPGGYKEVTADAPGATVAEELNASHGTWTPEMLKAAIESKKGMADVGRKALMGIGAGLGGVAGFVSPVPGGLAAGTLLGGGIGKSAGNAIFGPEQPEAPAINPAAGQGFGANARELLYNIPGSALKTANAGLGMMSDLSTAAVTPGGGRQVVQGVANSIKDLGSKDAWVTNPVGNAATLGMIADPAIRGGRSLLGKVGVESNPELAALSQQHDVPLTAGEQSGNASLKSLETQLERVPAVGTRGFREKQSSSLSAAANRLVDKFTPDNPVDVPDQIQENMLKTLKQGKSDVGNIQSQINEAVKTGNVEPIAPDNLREAATNLLDKFPDIFDRLPSTALKTKLTAIAEGTSPETSTIKVPGADQQGVIQTGHNHGAPASPSILDASGNPITRTVPAELTFAKAMLLREQLGEYINRAYKSAGAVGSKETYQLTELKRGLDKDISAWGENSNNSDVVDLFKQRNQAYIDKVAPFKDLIVKKATGNSFDTDLLYNQFVKSDRPQLAKKLLESLDPEGQQLVKYSVLKKAIEAGQDTKSGVPFSPAKFAQVIEKLGSTRSVIFPGNEGVMIDGFAKLARAAERAGQFAENPPTGLRASDTGISMGIGGGLLTHPMLTGGALGITKLISSMLTTEWGKSILMKAARTPESSPSIKDMLNQMQAKFKDQRGLVGTDINQASNLRGAIPEDIAGVRAAKMQTVAIMSNPKRIATEAKSLGMDVDTYAATLEIRLQQYNDILSGKAKRADFEPPR